MSPRRAVPASASCNVASVRISVDLPAPLGPRSPNMPVGMVSDTPDSALTPFGYILDRPEIVNSKDIGSSAKFGRVGAAPIGGDRTAECRRLTRGDRAPPPPPRPPPP